MPANVPDDPIRPRGSGGRHTLGSSPESQEPVEHVDLPPLPALDASAPLEPLRTLYMAWWRDARERARQLDPGVRSLFVDVLDHVEAGWAYVAPLQAWCEAHRDDPRDGDDAHLLDFIADDVVDLFREIASGVAALVPGYPGWEAEADPAEVDGDLDTFRRYFTVLRYAVEGLPAPAELRDAVRTAAQGLAGWSTELAVLVTAIEEAVL
ncbi:hypothetical protein [Longimicrobium sp.]|uniref:hypothetical protein n=1 Tax=Longimicrobium sp. TaxID=2029185 RepID=UPI002E323298|nr:hypothetical protein [Longimicrobium sp.]HEX6038972.1 hypothetical protein [Longimicrobium sp.]